jgi:hypothetical protein
MTTNISCKIVNSNNEPIVDAIVMVLNGSGSFSEMAAVTNEDGIAGLNNVTVPGDYRVQINFGGIKKEHTVQCMPEKTSFTLVY